LHGRMFANMILIEVLERILLSLFCVISFIEGLHVTIADSVITDTKNKIRKFQNVKELLGLITSATLR
jgi:hypothetical protein